MFDVILYLKDTKNFLETYKPHNLRITGHSTCIYQEESLYDQQMGVLGAILRKVNGFIVCGSDGPGPLETMKAKWWRGERETAGAN